MITKKDTIKIRLQTEGAKGRFKGPIDCLKQTIRKEGVFALYKGASPPLLGWVIMDSAQMFSLTNYRLFLQSRHPDTPLSLFEVCLAGLGSGLTVSLVAAPVEQIKGRLQIQYEQGSRLYSGPIDCAKKLVDGFRGLYHGLVPCLLFRSFFWALWGSYDLYSQLFRSWDVSENFVPFFSGGMAANTFWVLSFPADVVKNKIMTQPDIVPKRYPTMRSCFRHIYQTEGLRGFYRGFAPCILRSFPTNGAAVLVYETINSFMGGHSLMRK